MDVYDTGRPARSRRVTVNVNILRVGVPTFEPPYSTQIVENIATGVEVIKVNAIHPIPGVSFLLKLFSCSFTIMDV